MLFERCLDGSPVCINKIVAKQMSSLYRFMMEKGLYNRKVFISLQVVYIIDCCQFPHSWLHQIQLRGSVCLFTFTPATLDNTIFCALLKAIYYLLYDLIRDRAVEMCVHKNILTVFTNICKNHCHNALMRL